MSDLSKLADPKNREALLLAELAAWLHDIGKLSSEFINKQSTSNENIKWDHELVLKRATRRIESQLGKNLSEATKDDFRNLVENELNIIICNPKNFPNPFKSDFLDKLSRYLRQKNNANRSVSDVNVKNLIESLEIFLGKFINEMQISNEFLPNDFVTFAETNCFKIFGEKAAIADIIEQHGSPVEPKTELVKIFKPPGCDAIDSALDKGNLKNCTRGSKQGTDTFIANAFGFESKKILYIDQARQALATSEKLLTVPTGTRSQRKNVIMSNFVSALGETRRPANDVTLWDHSYSVGALYRTLLARIILENNGFPTRSNFLSNSEWASDSWCFLKIRTDGLPYLLGVSGIPDLLARKLLLEDSLNRIQVFLEDETPLGIEVYRDENGSIFVVPAIPNLLNDTYDGRKLRDHILEKFIQGNINNNTLLSIGGEVIPAIGPLSEPWGGITKIPSMGMAFSEESLYTDPESVNKTWIPIKVEIGETMHEFTEEICTVCSLRPQGYSAAQSRLDHYYRKAHNIKCPKNCPTCKAISRDVCTICEQRRDDRSEEWATEKLSTTIWIDEVADCNARLALIVGLFDLTSWLRGDLVRTMTICNPAEAQNKTKVILKNPSFARLRRIWETTRGFWQEIGPTDETEVLTESCVSQVVGLVGPRLEIRGKLRQKDGADTPSPYHAYDLVLTNVTKLSIAWDPEDGRSDGSKGRLVSIDNLTYFALLANLKPPSKEENESNYASRLNRWAAETIRELILQERARGTIQIEESTGYGGKAKEWGVIEIEDVEVIRDSQYTPAIPILAEPRTFMALVPADKALEVIKEIKAKYEREMGKVRNRLPLHLGIVYAHRRTPLRAILDAGRRMLEQSAKPGGWKVVDAPRKFKDRSDRLPERFSANSEGQFKEWLEILLEREGHRINWFVPAVMGDGQTIDQWYPFVFLDNSNEPVDRDRRFRAPNPWTGADGWLVHAEDLKDMKTDDVADVVYFTPATLDFQWLDSAGRRFEISYDEQRQRRSMPRRPYLLEEMEILEEIWMTLKSHLKKNQIYILRDLIESKREDWLVEKDHSAKNEVFRQFCRDALANAEWKWGKKDDRKDRLPWESDGDDLNVWLDKWADYAFRGWLADAIELHLQIMKEEI